MGCLTTVAVAALVVLSGCGGGGKSEVTKTHRCPVHVDDLEELLRNADIDARTCSTGTHGAAR